jgi:hypothetical protein
MNGNRPPVDLRAVCYEDDDEHSKSSDEENQQLYGNVKEERMCTLVRAI